MKRPLFPGVCITLLLAFSCRPAPQVDTPAIREWTVVEKDKDGKDVAVPYMTIDGVLVHESDPAKQPQPPVVSPGEASIRKGPGQAPSDAVVLFDGMGLSGWMSAEDGKPLRWTVRDGALMPMEDAGMIRSRQEFGSCQLHMEWATPTSVTGDGQGRGNSGVFIMGRYEVQILDSYSNPTYPDGQAAALYGRQPPLVNACRKPGEWQTYDIIFHRPAFVDGKVAKRATFTVFHNGVLVHDHYKLSGGTIWRGPHAVTHYTPHGDKGPLVLQDHGNPVRFRNIWLRELE